MRSLVPNELDVQMDADGTLQERGQRLQFGEPSLRAVHRSTLKLALQYFDLLLIEGSVAPWNDEPKARARPDEITTAALCRRPRRVTTAFRKPNGLRRAASEAAYDT